MLGKRIFPRFGQKIPIAGKSEAQSYTLLVSSSEDLLLIQNGLAKRAREVWVSYLDSAGPRWVRLPEFLDRI